MEIKANIKLVNIENSEDAAMKLLTERREYVLTTNLNERFHVIGNSGIKKKIEELEKGSIAREYELYPVPEVDETLLRVAALMYLTSPIKILIKKDETGDNYE